MLPLLSIITINYNNASGLDRTLSSINSQQDLAFEYIVVDGGSTDGSIDLIQKYSGKITTWVTEKDQGIYHAMNKGISMSTGKYLLFLNSGDEFNGKEALVEAMLQLHGADLITCNLLVVSETSEYVKKYPEYPTFQYFLSDTFPHPATFIDHRLFELTGGYDETLQIVSDWAFFMYALFRFNASHKHLPIVLSRFHLDGISSKTENRELIVKEKEQILANEFGRYAQLIEEWKEGQQLKTVINSSRLIKLAVKLGFLKPLRKNPNSNNS